MMHSSRESTHAENRRDFFRESSLLLAGAVPVGLVASPQAANYPSNTAREFRLGLVGCGFRGIAAAALAMNVPNARVRLCAVADVFEDRVQQACRSLKGKCPERFSVDRSHRFVGFDAHHRLLGTDVDVVILATPPGFRPSHFQAAVDAGKHVYAEKPIAADLCGARHFAETSKVASGCGLSVAVGLQRRHAPGYRETVKRLQEGAIGQLMYARSLCVRPTPRMRPRRAAQSELEYQLRNWQHYAWIAGDNIVEQHVQNLDVMNWIVGGHPLEAQGIGGWKNASDATNCRTRVFDHHSVHFTYDNDIRLMSMNSWSDSGRSEVAQWVHGTSGACDLTTGSIYDSSRHLMWQADQAGDGSQAAFEDFFARLSSGELSDEGGYAAESTMTAIMGRMATYSGSRIAWRECMTNNHALADFTAFQTLADAPPALSRI